MAALSRRLASQAAASQIPVSAASAHIVQEDGVAPPAPCAEACGHQQIEHDRGCEEGRRQNELRAVVARFRRARHLPLPCLRRIKCGRSYIGRRPTPP